MNKILEIIRLGFRLTLVRKADGWVEVSVTEGNRTYTVTCEDTPDGLSCALLKVAEPFVKKAQ